MKNIKYWLLVATLVCGSALFTACDSDDNSGGGGDSPLPPTENEVEQERDELLTLIEDDTETVVGNLETDGLAMLSQVNGQLMSMMGRGRNFIVNMQQVIAMLAVKNAMEHIKTVETGSKLDEMGYKYYLPVDISAFGVRVAFNERGDYDITPADGMEFVFPATVEGFGTTVYKMSFKNTGEWYESIASSQFGNVQQLAIVNRIPKALKMTLSGLFDDVEKVLFSSDIQLAMDADGLTDIVSLKDNNFQLTGQLLTLLKANGMSEDDGQLDYNVDFNHDGLTNIDIAFTQKGLKLVNLSALLTLPADNDFMGRLLDYILHFNNGGEPEPFPASVLSGGKSEVKMTILDNLYLAGSIPNLETCLNAMQDLSRNINAQSSAADINNYLKVVNSQYTMTIATGHSTHEVLMQMTAEDMDGSCRILPSLKFEDTPDYQPISELVSEKTIDSMDTIVSKAISPLGASAGSYVLLLSRIMQIMPLNSQEWGF